MNINYKKNALSKRIRITIKRNGEVLVTYPPYVGKKRAEKFLLQNFEYVQKKTAEANEARKIFDEKTRIKLPTAEIVIVRKETATRIYARKTEKIIKIFVPQKSDLQEIGVQEKIRAAITEAIRKEAKEYLPGKVETLAKRYGFSYRKVFVKNAATRWGSCSRKNNINLNLHLMRLPEFLCEYVILHELVHTEIKNHGKKFWERLNETTNGHAKILDKRLSEYSVDFL